MCVRDVKPFCTLNNTYMATMFCQPRRHSKTLTLQKLRMRQIRGVKGEAVVNYREPLTSLRQGFGPAGNKGDAVSSTFPRVENMTN